MSKPFVSFCIPTFNRANEVYGCVVRILENPNPEIEVVVQNNASTDDTLERLSTIKDARLRVESNDRNIGMHANCLSVVQRGHGRYSILLNDEDRVFPEKIDEVVDYFKQLQEEFILIRVGFLGELLDQIYPRDGVYLPAGPEAVSMVALLCGEFSGLAFNVRLIQEMDVKPYIYTEDDIAAKNVPITITFSLGYSIMKQCMTYPILLSPIVLHHRREGKEGKHDDGKAIVAAADKDDCGFSRLYYVPDNAYIVFCDFVARYRDLYKDSKYEYPLYFWALRQVCCEFSYSIMLRLMGHCSTVDWIAYKFRNQKWREILTQKYGTPWNAFKGLLQRCLAHLKFVTNDSTWEVVQKICDDFFADNLDASVEQYTALEKQMAGDLIYKLGSISTDNNYLPYYAPEFFSAEFMETNYIYRQYNQKRYKWVLDYPKLLTERDKFLRATACLRLKRYDDAEKYLREYLDSYTNAKTVRHIIGATRGQILALWYLGYIHQYNGATVKAMRTFKECVDLADRTLHTGLLLQQSLLSPLQMELVSKADPEDQP